jgi:polysaccharide deacetylase family sporulation protein PdaB
MKLYKGLIWGTFFFFTVLFAAKVEDHLIDISDVIWKVPTTRKVVALTFDDGPVSTTTPEILNILKEKNIKATFFVVGEQVKRYPGLVSQEIAEGHEVGNHTYTHPMLTNLQEDRIGQELKKTEKEILEVAPKPTLFRPPGGFSNKKILTLARDSEYSIILWSIDPMDWRHPPVGDIVNVVVKDAKPGSIILLHDGKDPSSTPEALWFIIDSLESRGYEFVTVTELLQYYEANK